MFIKSKIIVVVLIFALKYIYHLEVGLNSRNVIQQFEKHIFLCGRDWQK